MPKQAEEFLQSLLRGGPPGWPGEEGEQFERDFLEACRSHGVAPLLHHRLTEIGGSNTWPERLRLRLKSEEGGALLLQEVLDRELRRVLEALAEDHVSCLLLKGAAVARTAYPAPHLRPRSDADLWVRPADRPALETCLERLGYLPAPATGAELIQAQKGFQRTDRSGVRHLLDVHWKISNVQLFAEVLTFDEVWPRRRPVPGLGPAAHTLEPATALLFACLHRVAHHGASLRLIWLRDIQGLAARLDGEQVEAFIGLARAKDLRAVCRDGLACALNAFPEPPVCDELLEWANRPTSREEASGRFLERADVRAAIFLSDFRQLGTADRLRFVKEHLFPSPEYMLQRYGGRTRLALPLLYLRRALEGGWRILLKR